MIICDNIKGERDASTSLSGQVYFNQTLIQFIFCYWHWNINTLPHSCNPKRFLKKKKTEILYIKRFHYISDTKSPSKSQWGSSNYCPSAKAQTHEQPTHCPPSHQSTALHIISGTPLNLLWIILTKAGKSPCRTSRMGHQFPLKHRAGPGKAVRRGDSPWKRMTRTYIRHSGQPLDRLLEAEDAQYCLPWGWAKLRKEPENGGRRGWRMRKSSPHHWIYRLGWGPRHLANNPLLPLWPRAIQTPEGCIQLATLLPRDWGAYKLKEWHCTLFCFAVFKNICILSFALHLRCPR